MALLSRDHHIWSHKIFGQPLMGSNICLASAFLLDTHTSTPPTHLLPSLRAGEERGLWLLDLRGQVWSLVTEEVWPHSLAEKGWDRHRDHAWERWVSRLAVTFRGEVSACCPLCSTAGCFLLAPASTMLLLRDERQRGYLYPVPALPILLVLLIRWTSAPSSVRWQLLEWTALTSRNWH